MLFAASGRGSVPDEAFRSGLRERGYIEGKNIVIEKADRLRGLEVHCQSKRRGLLDRQVADLLAAQDLSQLSGQLTEHLGKVWTIADQSAPPQQTPAIGRWLVCAAPPRARRCRDAAYRVAGRRVR